MTDRQQDKTHPGFGEFIALMALVTCLVALSIDSMLPALTEIGRDLGAQGENDSQLIISVIFVGVASGQLFYGPLADANGRKPAVYIGFSLFILGTLLSLVAQDMSTMLVGRFLQGLGAAGPRIVTVAIVRDQYKGREMARVMSLIMTIFILCPVVAPMLGQGVLLIAGWREIFVMLLLLAVAALTWFGMRQPETLSNENRVPFSVEAMVSSAREILYHRAAVAYIVGLGFVFGAFIGFLNSIQQILQGLYNLGAQFPLYFAVLALGIGLSSFINSKLVMRFGMRPIALGALVFITVLSLLALPGGYLLGGIPPLWVTMFYFLMILFCVGLLFGNLNALAMEPFGHIAGMASGIVGGISTFIAVLLGTLVGQAFDGTLLPLITGFTLLGGVSGFITYWACNRCEKTELVAER